MRTCMLSKLAVVFLLSLALMLFLTQPALTADNAVNITQSDSVEKIQSNIQAAIDKTDGNGTVTITGSKKSANTTLAFDIPADVSVVWRADYAGNAENLIELKGTGTFEVATGTVEVAGGKLAGWGAYSNSAIRSDYGNVVVSGGKVSVGGTSKTDVGGYAIRAENGDVTVTGGMVEASTTGSIAIWNLHGNVNISGNANIRSTGDRYFDYLDYSDYTGGVFVQSISCAIHTNGGGGVVTVSGGSILATGDGGIAIATEKSELIISDDAIVTASGNTSVGMAVELYDVSSKAIESDFYSKVTINGGTVSATGKSGRAIDIIRSEITINDGMVSSSGKDGIAIYINGSLDERSAFATIYGGSVEGETAIVVSNGGVAAYLVGSCKGAFEQRWSQNAMIVEVASLNAGVAGTDAGLTIKAGTGSVNWITGGSIEFAPYDRANTVTLWWGDLGGFAPFIDGFEDNTFRGDSLMTREQFVAILFRLNNDPAALPTYYGTPSFKDVLPGRWSYDAIEWAKVTGLISANEHGNFRPAEALTRAEMAVMLVKVNELSEMAENTFNDIDGHEHYDDILKAVKAQVFTGYPDGSFKPDGFCTRTEAVTALVRYLLGGEPIDEMWENLSLSFSDVPRDFWAFKYIVLAVEGYADLTSEAD